jgi:anti-sigma factor RsiW
MASLIYRARFSWDHRWTPRHMSGYLDDDLVKARRSRLERHVSECEECRLLLASLRAMLDRLHQLPEPTGASSPAQLAASVRRRLR